MKEIGRWTQPGSEGSQRGEEAPARSTPRPQTGVPRAARREPPHPSPTRAQRVAGSGDPGQGARRRRGKGLPSCERTTGWWTRTQPLLTPPAPAPPGSHARLLITRRLPGRHVGGSRSGFCVWELGRPFPRPRFSAALRASFPFLRPVTPGDCLDASTCCAWVISGDSLAVPGAGAGPGGADRCHSPPTTPAAGSSAFLEVGDGGTPGGAADPTAAKPDSGVSPLLPVLPVHLPGLWEVGLEPSGIWGRLSTVPPREKKK